MYDLFPLPDGFAVIVAGSSRSRLSLGREGPLRAARTIVVAKADFGHRTGQRLCDGQSTGAAARIAAAGAISRAGDTGGTSLLPCCVATRTV
jgi:hypothetical protein